MELRTRLGGNGRVVIPAPARHALGIEPGDELIVVVEGREIRLMSLAEAVRRAQDIVGAYGTAGTSMADELIAERREASADE